MLSNVCDIRAEVCMFGTLWRKRSNVRISHCPSSLSLNTCCEGVSQRSTRSGRRHIGTSSSKVWTPLEDLSPKVQNIMHLNSAISSLTRCRHISIYTRPPVPLHRGELLVVAPFLVHHA